MFKLGHQDNGTIELLVRGVQEPGILRLGEAFALVMPCLRSVRVRSTSRAWQPGRVAINAASDTRVLWPPVTQTIARGDQTQ